MVESIFLIRGISAGTIEITDSAGQQAKTGQSSDDALDSVIVAGNTGLRTRSSMACFLIKFKVQLRGCLVL